MSECVSKRKSRKEKKMKVNNFSLSFTVVQLRERIQLDTIIRSIKT